MYEDNDKLPPDSQRRQVEYYRKLFERALEGRSTKPTHPHVVGVDMARGPDVTVIAPQALGQELYTNNAITLRRIPTPVFNEMEWPTQPDYTAIRCPQCACWDCGPFNAFDNARWNRWDCPDCGCVFDVRAADGQAVVVSSGVWDEPVKVSRYVSPEVIPALVAIGLVIAITLAFTN